MFRYIIPHWFILALHLTSILYVYLFIRETVVPKPSAKLFSVDNYKACWQLLSTGGGLSGQGGRFHRSKLWLYMLSEILITITYSGVSSLYLLYELSSPLCWGPELIGFGSALQNMAYLVSLLALKVLRSCISESSLALIGLVSSISGMVVFSVANTTALMFTGERTWRFTFLRCGKKVHFFTPIKVKCKYFIFVLHPSTFSITPVLPVSPISFICHQVTFCLSCTLSLHLFSSPRCPRW